MLVTTPQFSFRFYSVSSYRPVTAAWTPAWQTPPVRACSVVLQTAGEAVAVTQAAAALGVAVGTDAGRPGCRGR